MSFSSELQNEYNYVVSEYERFKNYVLQRGYETAVAATPLGKGDASNPPAHLKEHWGVSINTLDETRHAGPPQFVRGAGGRFVSWDKAFLHNDAKNRSGKFYAFAVEHGFGPGNRTAHKMLANAIEVMEKMHDEVKAR